MIRRLKENILKLRNILEGKMIYETLEYDDGKYYKIKTSMQFVTTAMNMKNYIDRIVMSTNNYTILLNFSGSKVYNITINLADGNTIASFMNPEWIKKILKFARKNKTDISRWNTLMQNIILKYI